MKINKFLTIFAIKLIFTACGTQNEYYNLASAHDHHNNHGHIHDHSHNHDHSEFEFLIEGTEGYINIYSSRHFLADEEIFRRFTEATGIGINVIFAHGGQVVERLRIEGESTQSDLIISDDGGILSNAKSHGLIMPVSSALLEANVPAQLRDRDNYWFALSYRARVLAMLEPNLFKNYNDLAADGVNVLLRPGNHLYNISLLASIIDIYGHDVALSWANSINNNRARNPQGNDRDQMSALVAGLGDVAMVNNYYLGLLLNSSNPEEVQVGESIYIVFPNQDTSGTHINISGMAVPLHSTNVEGAIAFMEFMTSEEIQTFLSHENYEFPVNINATAHPMLEGHLPFLKQDIDFTVLYKNHIQAIEIINIVGW